MASLDIEDLKKEFKRCEKDPAYFIENYTKVVHPIKGLVKFELYPFQKQVLNHIHTKNSTIMRKFRQAGMTTLCAGYALWFCMFHSHKTVMVLSKDDDASKEVVSRIKVMYEELPAWIKPNLLKNSEHTIKFENLSIVRSKASSKNTGRSISASLLIMDEMAFIEHAESIWTASQPTLSTGGKICCVSTTNGVGNFFHTMWVQAVNKENSLSPLVLDWRDHPEYNIVPGYEHLHIENWYENNRPKYSFKQWNQEFLAQFEGTGDTYIDGEILVQLKSNCSNDFYIKYNNRMRVWKEPQRNHDYVLAADPSIGRERDFSAFHIIDVYNGEQVAEFYSNRTPLNEFADIIAKEARIYNTAYVLTERNGIGNNLIYFLRETNEYENLVMDEHREIGIQVTQKNREQLLANMEDAIRSLRVRVNSERLVNELLTFIIDPETGKIEADANCHDDLILAFAIAISVFNDLRGSSLIERDTLADLTPNNPSLVLTTRYKVATATGGISEEDLKWLIGK